jgi:hypothetical protein
MKAFWVLAVLIACTAVAPAQAKGTVTIQQRSGTIKTYPGVKLAIGQKSLVITSVDGVTTVTISRGSCTGDGELRVCSPKLITVDQHGVEYSVGLRRGTVYLNLTNAPVQLSFSSVRLQPNSILMSLYTDKGTVINGGGTIDADSHR